MDKNNIQRNKINIREWRAFLYLFNLYLVKSCSLIFNPGFQKLMSCPSNFMSNNTTCMIFNAEEISGLVELD